MRLGELLTQSNLLAQEPLQIALLEQRLQGGLLGQHLIKMGFLDLATLNQTLALQHDLVPAEYDLDTLIDLAVLTEKECRDALVLPFAQDDNRISIMTSHLDWSCASLLEIRQSLLSQGWITQFFFVGEEVLERCFDVVFGYELVLDDLLQTIQSKNSLSHLDAGQANIELLNRILRHAVKHTASDLHFEAESGYVRLRYRIDGVLQQILLLHQSFYPALLVRLKIMAKLDVAEQRMPQDGHFSFDVEGRGVDFRISTMPVNHGESVVLRVLDRHKGIVPLAQLGLSPDAKALLDVIIDKPHGIVLITGPTGSGKTTTLYSILQALNSGEVSILTLEDPVEYPIHRIRQTPINDEIGLSFLHGVRAQLRQDPDIIFIGEIRDHETAQMALRAALTGHKVFATLHCSSALTALPRLAEMGISPAQLAGNLAGVVAQRLVRKLCPYCQKERKNNSNTECSHCFQGFRGRLPILEVLNITKRLDSLMFANAHVDQMMDACTDNLLSLQEDGRYKVAQNETSMIELKRVIDIGGLDD